MLSVNRVIVQTLVFILHMYTCVLHLTMCAMRCVGVRSEKGVWENFHACTGAGLHVAQSFSTSQLSRGQSHGCEVYRLDIATDLTQSLGGPKVCAHPPASFGRRGLVFPTESVSCLQSGWS